MLFEKKKISIFLANLPNEKDFKPNKYIANHTNAHISEDPPIVLPVKPSTSYSNLID